MILKQYYLDCLSHASYLLGDAATRTAVIVDPQRDVDQYLEDASQLGLEIRHVILTHFHADFAAGHIELRERTGAVIHLGRRAEAEYAFSPLEEGQRLDYGSLGLGVLETPGHTPEGISLLVYDLGKSGDAPHAVLTGDTLFIGDVGRPDLMASAGITAEELAGMLYDSLHEKLLRLPDETLVYPAHGAGSACGKNLSTDTVSTIGAQRRSNLMLQPMSREEFVRISTEDLPPAPAYFSYAAGFNHVEHSTLAATLERGLKALPLDRFLAGQAGGARVLDTRSPAEFAAGHLAGSLNIGLGGRYASWAGTLLPPGGAILLVTEPGREQESALRLGRIGFDNVSGYLEGGPASFEGTEHQRRIGRVDAAQLARELAGSAPPLVLDVRGPGEREECLIEGSQHIPLGELPGRVHEVPQGRRIVVQCAGGYRSMIAASVLEPHGFTDLADLEGGIKAWQESAAVRSDSA